VGSHAFSWARARGKGAKIAFDCISSAFWCSLRTRADGGSTHRWALATQIGGAADAPNVGLAWAYVGTRVVHSLIQATRNVIPIRFAVFAVGSMLLLVLLVRSALQLL